MKRIKLIFFTSLIFILLLGTISEANSNLTLKNFKEIVKADGYNMDNVTFPSYFNQLLNNNPIIFYNQDRSKIMCFTGIISTNRYGTSPSNTTITIGIANNQYTIGYSYYNETTYPTRTLDSFKGYNISGGGSSAADYRIGCSINLTDYSFSDIASGFNGYQCYYGNVYPYIGYTYSYYQNDYTLDNFKSLVFIKSKLLENMIFYGKPLYYSNNDIFYRFDGIFKGNDYYKPISSEFTINTSMVKFEYEAFKGYSDEYVTINGFYLQQFTPNSAVKIDDTYLSLEDLSEQDTLRVQTGRKAQFNFLGLKNLMEKGYIYRLVAHSKASKNDVSGETNSYATSCFFSLDSWKSTAIEVININKFLNAESSEIEIIPSDDDKKSEDNNIISSIINGNKDFWGNSGDLNGDNQQENIKNGLNDLINGFSGELSNNSIFQIVELAELGFIDILQGTPGDFKIRWNSANYLDNSIVPAGEINFTQMCKDIPILGNVKTFINIIISAFLGFNLIKYLYNLILSTLGIDNPYLYETDLDRLDRQQQEQLEHKSKLKRVNKRGLRK